MIHAHVISRRDILSSYVKYRPMRLGESTKGSKVPESNLSEIHAFHTFAYTTALGCHSIALDYRGGGWVLSRSDSFAQLSSDRDLVKDRPSANHPYAGSRHRVKLRLAQSCSGTIIPLKSRGGISDNLRLWPLVSGGFILLDHKKDGC